MSSYKLKLLLGLRAPVIPVNPGEISNITPGALWSGTANSGFTVVPSDPSRTGPKCVLRLLQDTTFLANDGDIVLGVRGGAFGGLQKVIAHFEGRSVDIPTETRYVYSDPKGAPYVDVGLTGYFIRIRKQDLPVGTYGVGHVYFEAVPNNPLIQRTITPRTKIYWTADNDTRINRVIQIDPDLASDTVGVSYRTHQAAAQYVRSQAWLFPELRAMKTANYKLGKSWGSNNTGTRIRLTAASGVTATFYWDDPNNFTDRDIRTGYNGLHFKGPNVIWDQRNVGTLYGEDDGGENHNVFEGCVVTNSMGAFPLIRGYTLGQPIATRNALFLECLVSNIRGDKSFSGTNLARNNVCTGMNSDVFVDANCAVGNKISESYVDGYTNLQPSATIAYTGSGTATLSRIPSDEPGSNGSASGTGGSTGYDHRFRVTIDGVNYDVAITKGPGFNSVQSVVDQWNAIPGIVAVNLHPDENWQTETDRAAMALSTQYGGRAFAATPLSSTPLTLYTSFDIHADMMQTTSVPKINCVFADNIGFNVGWQWLLAQSTSAEPRVLDWYVVNNCSYLGDRTVGIVQSHIQYHAQHLIMNNNTIINQTLTLTSLTADAYCEGYGNVFNDLSVGSASNGTWLAKNRFINGVSGAGTQKPTDYVTGGSVSSLVLSAKTGDFTPIGDLASVTIPTITKYDALGNLRSANDVMGAIRKPTTIPEPDGLNFAYSKNSGLAMLIAPF